MPDESLAVEFDEAKIDAIFAELDQSHLPGAAVGIAIKGKPVYRKGFGRASMELPVVLSPTIRMRIYSISKHFTCFAYMLLCEEGRAGIDDALGKYLPELHPVTHRVTMRQLMTHTGGLLDALDVNWAFSGVTPRVTSDELLAFYRDSDHANFAPGTAWRYSNGGILLLGAAIERITGQTLEQVLWERIFEPVGMYDSLLRRWDTDFVPNSATMHMTKPTGGFDRSYEGGALDGGGGIVSTVDDMLRWLAHMDAPSAGSTATWAVMKAPQTLANGTSTGYGLGLNTSPYRGLETLWHDGGGLGANAQMLKVAAAGLDVVIMVNRHDVQSVLLANKIVDACLPSLDPVAKSSNRSAVRGTFRSPATGRVIQLLTSSTPSLTNRTQQIVPIDGSDLEFEPPDEKGVLRPARIASYNKWVVKLIGDPNSPTSIQFNDFGNLDELLPVSPPAKTDVSAIAGRYRWDATGTEVTISKADDGPRLDILGRFGPMTYGLECLGDGLWRGKPKPASASFFCPILSFDREGGAFRFSIPNATALPFRRCA